MTLSVNMKTSVGKKNERTFFFHGLKEIQTHVICGIFQIFKRDECAQVTGLNALMDDSKKWMFPGM